MPTFVSKYNIPEFLVLLQVCVGASEEAQILPIGPFENLFRDNSCGSYGLDASVTYWNVGIRPAVPLSVWVP